MVFVWLVIAMHKWAPRGKKAWTCEPDNLLGDRLFLMPLFVHGSINHVIFSSILAFFFFLILWFHVPLASFSLFGTLTTQVICWWIWLLGNGQAVSVKAWNQRVGYWLIRGVGNHYRWSKQRKISTHGQPNPCNPYILFNT